MNMMATGLRIECVAETGDRLGETPLWCDVTERLWWIDIENPRLHSYDPSTGQCYSNKKYLESPLSKDWPAGMIDRINAL